MEQIQVAHELSAGFDEFYRQHHAVAVGWATALVGNRSVGEDLAHDALIRVGSRLDELENPAAYLRRSVVNACTSWHRGQARHDVPESGLEHDDPRGFDASTLEVLDLLSMLPQRQRAALVLRYWADWTTAEIADALGLRASSVRVLAHRALRRLNRELSEMEDT